MRGRNIESEIEDLIKQLNGYVEQETKQINTNAQSGFFKQNEKMTEKLTLANTLIGNLKELNSPEDMEEITLAQKSQALCFYIISYTANNDKIGSSDLLDKILKDASKKFKDADPENFQEAKELYKKEQSHDKKPEV